MKKSLSDKLLQNHSRLLVQHELPITQSCMGWGFECGNGWYSILDDLFGKIQNYIDANNLPQTELVQVKEKFGTLRVYCNRSDDYIEDLIAKAEELSGQTCERCGSTDNVHQTTGWITTTCKKCAEEREKES